MRRSKNNNTGHVGQERNVVGSQGSVYLHSKHRLQERERREGVTAACLDLSKWEGRRTCLPSNTVREKKTPVSLKRYRVCDVAEEANHAEAIFFNIWPGRRSFPSELARTTVSMPKQSGDQSASALGPSNKGTHDCAPNRNRQLPATAAKQRTRLLRRIPSLSF